MDSKCAHSRHSRAFQNSPTETRDPVKSTVLPYNILRQLVLRHSQSSGGGVAGSCWHSNSAADKLSALTHL